MSAAPGTLAPADAEALAALLAAERARRDTETAAGVRAILGAVPRPLRGVVGKALGA